MMLLNNSPVDMPFDCFRILSVHLQSTDEEVKNSYRRLCMSHHPDRMGGGASDLFLMIQQAYERAKGASRPQLLKELQVYGDLCVACDHSGIKRQMRRGIPALITPCEACNGAGYTRRVRP